MATTGEKQDYSARKFYAETRCIRWEKTLADINIDGVNPWAKPL